MGLSLTMIGMIKQRINRVIDGGRAEAISAIEWKRCSRPREVEE
jgi:hypothetical protein